MKKIHLISLSLFLIWGCGGGGGSGDSPQAPVVSGGTLSITWNMSQSAAVEENSNGATLIDATLNNSTVKLSFSLSGTDSSKFSISNGYLVFTDVPDYENPLDSNADNSYALTINASGAGISSSHSFSVNVNNINEAPSLVTDSSTYFQVNENSTAIKQIVASDPENDSVVYSLQDSSGSQDENLLEINSSTGEVSFKSAPNYEAATDINTDNTVIFTVIAGDGTLTGSKEYYAAIVNVKETPTDIYFAANSVSENNLGANFGTVTVIDEDPVGIKTLALSGTDAINFEVGPSLSIKFKPTVSADFETKASYSLDLTVTDNDDYTLSKTLTLNILDGNDAPTAVSISGGSAAENSSGASFGTLSSTDPDASDTYTYTVTGGTDASSFEIGTNNILKFKSTVSGNFETKSSYNVIVTTTDSGTLSASSTLTVFLTDVNESPTDLYMNGGSVPENSAGGVFGSLYSTDPDASDTFTYTVTGGADASSFEIGAYDDLKFKSSVSGDFETKSSYAVTLTTTDAGSNTFSKAFTVLVLNVNENPSFSNSQTTNLLENQTVTATAFSFFGTDPENNDLTFSITGGADADKFSISAEGTLTMNRVPDYEIPTDSDGNNVYTFTVTVSDGTNSSTQSFSLTIIDVNEPNALNVPENIQTVETQE